MVKKYFLDTYALIEIIKGNPSYKRYTEEEGHTSLLNLYELYFQLLRNNGEGIAKSQFYLFKQLMIEISDNNIFSAAEFKLAEKRKNVSYTDALGYEMAKAEGLIFLTGDEAFKSLPNVEFVK